MLLYIPPNSQCQIFTKASFAYIDIHPEDGNSSVCRNVETPSALQHSGMFLKAEIIRSAQTVKT
jgi:hypothetical protein